MNARPSLAGLLAVGVLAALVPAAWADSTPRARLERVVGGVAIQRSGQGNWVLVTSATDHNLYAGDRVQTYQQAQAWILIQGARVILGPRTQVLVPAGAARQAPSKSFLQQITGRILGWLVGTHQLEIGSGGAVATASGTRFALEVGADGVTTLTVLEGEVSFHNDLGQVVVKQGEQSSASTAAAPRRPMAVDTSGYLEWEASLDNLWMGFETRHSPSEPRERLQELAVEAERQAAEAPQDPAAQRRAGDLLHDLGDLPGAEAAYGRTLALTPNDPAAHLALGYSLLQEGRSAESQAEFEAAAKLAPAAAEPLVGQALANLAAGTAEGRARAETLVARGLQAEPKNALAHTVAGLLATRRGDAAAAKAALEQALSLDPSGFQAYSYLAAVQLAEGNGAAVETARRAVALAPASGLAHEALGTAEFFAHHIEAAEKEADLALEANPDSAAAHLLRSDIEAARGDLARALHEAQLSVTLDPLLAPAYNAIGMIALGQNDLLLAERGFTKALQLSPNLVSARTGIGVTYARQGKLAAALEQQHAAVALDSRLAATRNNLGAVYLARGRLPEAVEEFEQAIELQPEWGLPHANLALAYLDLNRFADAVREGEAAVHQGEDSARLYTTLARVYLKQERTNKAWEALRRALERDENYALAHLELAEVYVRQGRSRDAVREQLEGIALQPSATLESREYARTEVQSEAGSFLGGLRTDGIADHGQTSGYLNVQHQQDDADRPHSHWEQTTTLSVLGRQTSADRTQAFYLSTEQEHSERPGKALAGGAPEDPDYISRFSGFEGQYLARVPAGQNGKVTVKLGYRSASQFDHNPDSLSAGDPKPFRELRLRYDGLLAETRLDQRLSSRQKLVAGIAVSGEQRVVSGVLGTPQPPPNPPVWTPFSDLQQHNGATGYLEHEQRLSPRTRLMLGGRAVFSEGATPVVRPKASFRQDMGRSGLIVLLTRPLLRDDVSELSPVDRWSLPDSLSPLSFAAGGFSQSYELQYQLTPRNGSLLRVTGFHRSLRNLIVDLQDPSLSAGDAGLVLGSGVMHGAEVEWEQWLTHELSAGAWVQFVNAENGSLDIPLQPRFNSRLRLDYLNHGGYRVALVWSRTGGRYADLANTLRLAGYDVVDLSVARQFSLHTDVFIIVDDLLNEGPAFWPGYPGPGRTIRGGVRYRF